MEDKRKVSGKKTRDSNFELLRIISMLLILVWHYMQYGGALTSTHPFEPNFIIAYFTRAFSDVAVNCYIMISGYFLINSEFHIKKLISLWRQILFYSLVIGIGAMILGIESFSYVKFIKLLFPIIFKQYWFISCFVVLFILSPYLNIAIKSMSKIQFKRLTLILVFTMIIWGSFIPSDGLEINSPFSLTQFVFLYVIGAYIRLYWKANVNKYWYLLGYITCAILTGIMIMFIFKIGKGSLSNKFTSYDFIGVNIETVCLFLFMKQIKIKSRFINKVASSTLAVYLIHEHPMLRNTLYKILKTSSVFHSKLFIIYAIVSVLVTFSICILIDFLRKIIFSKISDYTNEKPIFKPY